MQCPRLDRGFTLIEMLVTMAIMAMVMMALQVSLQSTLMIHDDIALEIASVREGPKILDLIERDLRGLHTYNIKDGQVMRGELQRHLGMRGDRMDLITSTDSATRIRDPESSQFDPRMVSCDINEVGYRLRPHPDSSDFMQLYRREDMYLDEEPMEGGRYELLHDHVTRCQITYLDRLGEDGEELEEWDMAEQERLPAAVRIDLELQAHPELIGDFVEAEALAQRLYTYTRVVPIPASHRDTLKIRPVIPLKFEPMNQEDEDPLGQRGTVPDNPNGQGVPGSLGDGALGGPGGPGRPGGPGGPGGQGLGGLQPNGGIPLPVINIDDPSLNIDDDDRKILEDLLREYRNNNNGGGNILDFGLFNGG